MSERYAVLDAAGVLKEYRGRKPAKGTRFVDLGSAGADLEPGKYRFSEADGCFEPVTVTTDTTLPPDAHMALSSLIKALHEQGIAIPEKTRQWLKSVDGKPRATQ